jgi:hypothetical protein
VGERAVRALGGLGGGAAAMRGEGEIGSGEERALIISTSDLIHGH